MEPKDQLVRAQMYALPRFPHLPKSSGNEGSYLVGTEPGSRRCHSHSRTHRHDCHRTRILCHSPWVQNTGRRRMHRRIRALAESAVRAKCFQVAQIPRAVADNHMYHRDHNRCSLRCRNVVAGQFASQLVLGSNGGSFEPWRAARATASAFVLEFMMVARRVERGQVQLSAGWWSQWRKP